MELLNDFPHAIDNTIRTTWDLCPAKFRFSHLHHLRVRDPSIHLVFGAAYAKGLEVLREEFYGGNTSKQSYMARAYLAATKEWAKGLDDPMQGEVKSFTNMLCALTYYVQEFPLESDWIQPLFLADGKAAVEFTFAIPLPIDHPVTGDPLLYTGRFDMFADYGGEPAVYDDKTAMQLGPSWVRGWEMDSQMTGYIWAAQQHGFKTNTAIIRGVSILKNSFGNANAIQHRQDWELERWYQTLLVNIQQMIDAWKAQQFRYSLGGACKSYSGCEYTALCKQDDWEKWVEPDYHVFIWNPLDIKKDKEPQGEVS